MTVNPGQFQVICVDQKTDNVISSFQLNEIVIKSKANVILLGFNIDFLLNFNDHMYIRKHPND